MRLNTLLALVFAPVIVSGQQSGYVTVSDGARIFFRTSGRPGPGVDTIIAIHGGPGLDLGTIYNDMAAMFGDRHVVIYYDQRGGGRSELPADTHASLRPAADSGSGRPAQAFRPESGHARRALVRTIAGRELCHRASGERQEDDLLRACAAEERRLQRPLRAQLQRATRQHAAPSDAGRIA